MTALTHFQTPLLQTPFHPRLAPLNRQQNWGAWAGYLAAGCFGDAAIEHTAIRNTATLYDISPMIKYRITGPDAVAYLNRLTLRDAGALAPGQVQYTAWCDDQGKLMDDGTLFRLGEADFRLCCQERHLPWLLDSAFGFAVTIRDESEDLAALALQGPVSATVLDQAGFDVRALKPFRQASFEFGGGEIAISRTGFTGDLGYELWLPPALALPLWDHLMQAGALYGLTPIGGEAVMLARTEAGFLTTGLDFIPVQQALREDRARSPFELGLGWMIAWEKGHFTGRRALQAEKQNHSSAWALVGLEIPGNISAEGAILYQSKKREVGFITAACWSPTLKRNIAIAHVESRYADCRDLWVEIYAQRELQYHKLMLKVARTARPFFAPERRRATPPARW
ncbi:aminomethyltransferase family protein [Pseudogemmobacter faecipullorum]|uniref:Aminomethyl transferase family protein n=1 Tax=Pseudogemmobacter faecipullorum TaxID=2755041 RepID=A0ABS8CPZ4_9RHOB|nr:aminomethyltransferase family protein [Pseudogemmobacter faecipullorum]MCB5411472.1 aminomethyl transferase family protein [Pseudogemmobacter faecipullorum]